MRFTRRPSSIRKRGSAAVADDGTIYVGSHDGHLYAIKPNGVVKWKATLLINSLRVCAVGDKESDGLGTPATSCIVQGGSAVCIVPDVDIHSAVEEKLGDFPPLPAHSHMQRGLSVRTSDTRFYPFDAGVLINKTTDDIDLACFDGFCQLE